MKKIVFIMFLALLAPNLALATLNIDEVYNPFCDPLFEGYNEFLCDESSEPNDPEPDPEPEPEPDPEPVVNTCLIPIVSGGSTVALGTSEETSLQSILDTAFPPAGTVDAVADQTLFEIWSGAGFDVSFKATLLGAYAGNPSTFGYFKDATYTVVPTDGSTVVVSGVDNISFAIKTTNGASIDLYSTNPAQNSTDDTNDHAAVYNPLSNIYALGFEDLSFSAGDEDYNDKIVKLEVVSCSAPEDDPEEPPVEEDPAPTPTPESDSQSNSGSSSDNGGGTSSSGSRRHSSGGGGASGNTNGGGEVLGASTGSVCENYLNSYIKLGANNDPEEVKKLQIFLNQFFQIDIPVTGVYGPITFDWVKKFQEREAFAILAPWASAGLPTGGPTGYVYKTTLRWINISKCPESILNTPIPSLP